MDCLICFKLFIKEPLNETGLSYPAILCKLLRLTSQPPVDLIFKESSICQRCHLRLETVNQLLLDLEEIDRKLNLVKSEVENELEESRQIGEVIVQSGQSLSKASLARCKLFDEITIQKKKNAQEHLIQVQVPQQECTLDESISSSSSSIQVQDSSTLLQHSNAVVEIKMEMEDNEIVVDAGESFLNDSAVPEPPKINQNKDNMSITSEAEVNTPTKKRGQNKDNMPISSEVNTPGKKKDQNKDMANATEVNTPTKERENPTIRSISAKINNKNIPSEVNKTPTTTPSKEKENKENPTIKPISVKNMQNLLERSTSKTPPSTAAKAKIVVVPLHQLQANDEEISVNLNDDKDFYTQLKLKEFTISLERLELPTITSNADTADANKLKAPYNINEEPIASYMIWSEMKIRELQKTRNFKPMKIFLRCRGGNRNRKLKVKVKPIIKRGSRKSGRQVPIVKVKEKAQVKYSSESEEEKEKNEDLKCLFGGCEFYGKNKRGLRVHRYLKHRIIEKGGRISNNTNDIETDCEEDSIKIEPHEAFKRRKRRRRSFANFSTPRLKCKICRSTNTFSSKASLHRHILGHKAASGKCTICNQEFPSSSALIAHWREHKQTFDCTSCGKSFLRETDYSKHKEGESKESKFPCSECDQIYENENCLKFHHAKKHPKYQCTFCLKRFSINHKLQNHLGFLKSKPNEKSKELYKCRICNVSNTEFENRNCFRYHMEVNHPSSFECELCSDFKGSSASSLKEHRKSVHKILSPRLRRRFKNPNEKHECQICSRVFKTSYSLSNHVSKIVKGVVHSCPFCLVIFPSPLCLRYHETTQHGNETVKEDDSSEPRLNENEEKTGVKIKKQFHCLVCKKIFPNRHMLRIHAMVHTGLKPCVCPVENCGRTFRIKELLKNHQLTTHATSFPFNCTHDSCTKKYADERLLKRHIYSCHSNKKFYKCRFPECSEKFDHITAKNEHQVSQHGYISKNIQALIKCKYCEKSFKNENANLEHESIHTKVRNFICTHEDCGKKFWKFAILKSHQLSHSKNFKCDICYEKYSSQGRLNIHYNYHTRERKFRCNFCSKVYYSASNLHSHNKRSHKSTDTGNKNKKRKFTPKRKIEVESDIEIDEAEMNDYLVTNDNEMEVESRQDCINATTTDPDNEDDKEKLKLFCGICHSNFPDFTSLEDHLKLHSKPKRKTTENK